MSNKLDRNLLSTVKQGFVPMPGGAPPAPPMDPSMMGGAPPMDPSMGGAPPMDPSMGGAPPMDPSMGGAPPMDPSMGGGIPPMDPSMVAGMDPSMMAGMDPSMIADMLGSSEGGQVTMSVNDLINLIRVIQGQEPVNTPEQPGVAMGGAPEEGGKEPKKRATNADILEAITGLSSALGAAPPPPTGMDGVPEMGQMGGMEAQASDKTYEVTVPESVKVARVVKALDTISDACLEYTN